MKSNAVLCLLLISSCSYNNISNDPLFGKWSWVKTTGGFSGATSTPASEGYTMTLILASDLNFQRLKNNIVASQGKFSLEKKTEPNLIEGLFIKFDDNGEFLVSQSANSLILNDTYADGYTYYYQKINN